MVCAYVYVDCASVYFYVCLCRFVYLFESNCAMPCLGTIFRHYTGWIGRIYANVDSFCVFNVSICVFPYGKYTLCENVLVKGVEISIDFCFCPYFLYPISLLHTLLYMLSFYLCFPPDPPWPPSSIPCIFSCSLRQDLAKGEPEWPLWGRTWGCSSEISRWASGWARCPVCLLRRSM